MTQERKIIWARFEDPVAPLVRGRKARGYVPEEDEDDPDYHAAARSLGKNTFSSPDNTGKFGPAVLGPYGVVPFMESNLPSALFNMWMGHTTFGIDAEVMDVIEGVPGVESLDVYSPYRFRISVGRAFKENKVLKDIELAVQPPAPAEAAVAPARVTGPPAMERAMSGAFPYWASVRDDAGKTAFVGGGTPEEVMEKTKHLSGRVKTSWEV